MQKIRLTVNEHYGDEVIQLPLPGRWNVHRVEMACKDAPQLNDDEIRAAIDNTVGASTIEEQAKGKKGRIVVTCDDLSRPTPAGRVFPFIVEQLHNAGISDSQIFILGSFGCHHAMNLDACPEFATIGTSKDVYAILKLPLSSILRSVRISPNGSPQIPAQKLELLPILWRR